MNKFAVAILLCLGLPKADAQPTLADRPGEYLYSIIDAQSKAMGIKVSPFKGYVKAGVAGVSVVDNTYAPGTAVGVFGIAEGRGGPFAGEVVGVYGMAQKNGIHWATGLHGECLLQDGEADSKGLKDEGGLCIGTNIELIGNNRRSDFIGLNIQPRSGAHDVIGIQLQNPESYRYAISAPNVFWKFGQVDDVSFCMRFVPEHQALEFWRGCGKSDATRHGWINMNWGTPDRQLN